MNEFFFSKPKVGDEWGIRALTYVLDDPTDCGLKQLIHSLTGHPEHPL